MEERIEVLESSELEGGPEGIGVLGYCQLLALYLADGQLCHSKFLWKRIPASMKTNAELVALWTLGQKMWLRDVTGLYAAALAFQWSTTIAPIVNQLVEGVREKMQRLLGTAYTYIRRQDVANLVGVNEEEVVTLMSAQGWKVAPNEMLQPVEPPSIHVLSSSAEDQISKLTDYVAFLEN